MDALNIGVLGGSQFAIRSMIPAIRALDDRFRLAGIASRRPERVKEWAEAHQARLFAGYHALLELEDLDAVYIPLPNALHAEWIERALERGLHVLVEKSLACSHTEALHVDRMAREKKCVLLEDFHFRFHGQMEWIHDAVRSGRLGQLRCIRSSFGIPPFRDADNIRYQQALGGGARLDVGAYPVKLAQLFMGEELTVGAARLVEDSARGVDMWGGAFLAQRGGDLFADIAFGFDNHYQCSLELWGSEGKLSTNRIFTCPKDRQPVVVIEARDGKEIRTLPADDQIRNLLAHFHALTGADDGGESEYRQNVNQARLLEELKERAHEL